MTLFLLTYSKLENTPQIMREIAEKLPEHKLVSQGAVLLASSDHLTPKDLFQFMSPTDEIFGRVLVVAFNSYWGWHDGSVWEWIQSVQG